MMITEPAIAMRKTLLTQEVSVHPAVIAALSFMTQNAKSSEDAMSPLVVRFCREGLLESTAMARVTWDK